MTCRLGYILLLLAAISGFVSGSVGRFEVKILTGDIGGLAFDTLLTQLLLVASVVFAVSRAYLVAGRPLLGRTTIQRYKLLIADAGLEIV